MQGFSVLFLKTSCESTILSIKTWIKAMEWDVLQLKYDANAKVLWV